LFLHASIWCHKQEYYHIVGKGFIYIYIFFFTINLLLKITKIIKIIVDILIVLNDSFTFTRLENRLLKNNISRIGNTYIHLRYMYKHVYFFIIPAIDFWRTVNSPENVCVIKRVDHVTDSRVRDLGQCASKILNYSWERKRKMIRVFQRASSLVY